MPLTAFVSESFLSDRAKLELELARKRCQAPKSLRFPLTDRFKT
jgi:hypothetical protein